MTLQKSGTSLAILQVASVVDLGAVWNRSNNPNQLPSQMFLAGTGLGIILEPAQGLTIRADYAVTLVGLSDRGNNTKITMSILVWDTVFEVLLQCGSVVVEAVWDYSGLICALKIMKF